MLIRVVDTETSSNEPDAGVCELGFYDIVDGTLDGGTACFVNPGKPIEPGARGVHHITDAEVARADALDLVAPDLLMSPRPDLFAAHEAEFELTVLKNFVDGIPWICTKKCAMRIWPEAPDFKLQTLRYWLGIGRIGPQAFPVHRAGPDSVVAAHLMMRLLHHASIADMVTWSAEYAVWPRIPFTKERGKLWSEVDAGLLQWITGKEDIDAEMKWNAQRELDRRDDVRRDTYVARALDEIRKIDEVKRLEVWFTMNANARLDAGIPKESAAWHQIVAACQVRRGELPAPPPPTETAPQ